MKPEIILIAAMDRDRVIGRDNDIPWRGKLPADMAHFQDLTMGHTVVMGRKTWESIPTKFRPLTGRINVVLTHDGNFIAEGAYTATDLMQALSYAHGDDVYIIGGAEIYKQFVPLADRLELTCIDTSSGGDTFFPEIDVTMWCVEKEVPYSPDEKNAFAYTFRSYIRI